MFKLLKDYFTYWYFQYELITNIYMFEPWEKFLLHGLLVCIIGLITYSSFVYLPTYLVSLWKSYTDLLSDFKAIYY
ncbi:unnamed protein product [Nezara viridula]|uniref:Serine palmitoyltransferase small subunit B n=1 Tax=Nezara viridula TaxID=85310 RepID=A0A9P0E6X2_NEZVI|nr:unnamed protein product [Nezara viridula]